MSGESARVFISYSSKDLAFAEQIEQALVSADIEVWRDKSRIEKDWSREIAVALSASGHVCLVWSANAAASNWVSHEWMTARALGLPLHILVRTDAPSLPVPLQNVESILIDQAADAAAWLTNRVRSATRLEYDYSILPGSSQIPFLPNPSFVGRNAELVDIYLNVIAGLNQLGRSFVGLTGLPGVGKTQLAVEFAYRFAWAFDRVLWLQGTDPLEWRPQCSRLGRLLGGPSSAGLDDTAAILQLQETLSQPSRRTLLVVDNVVDPALLNRDSVLGPDVPFTMLTLGASIFFTTRRALRLPGVKMHEVESMGDAAAFKLLTASREPTTADEVMAARAICAALGNLPLGIVLAGGFLRKYDQVTFDAYLRELRGQTLETLDQSEIAPEELATRHEVTFASMMQGHFRALDDPARALLTLIAQFLESSIVPRARLRLLFDEPVGRRGLVPPFDRASRLLEDIHLAEVFEDADAVRLHPIVRAFALDAAGDAEALRQRAAERLGATYSDAAALEQHVRKRGVEEVAEDVAVALAWSPAGSETLQALQELRLLLDRERVHLSLDERALREGNAFAQQMHWRAAQTGFMVLAAKFAASLARAAEPRFVLETVVPLDDPALLRTVRGPVQDETFTVISHVRAHAASRSIVTASWRSAVIWQSDRILPLRSFVLPKGYILDAVLASGGDELLTVGNEGDLVIWNAHTGETIREISLCLPARAHTGFTLRDVAFTPDGSVLLAAYDNRESFKDWERGLEAGTAVIARWRVAEAHVEKPIKLDAHWLNAVGMDETGRLAASPGADNGTVELWDLESGKRLRVFGGYRSHYAIQSPSALLVDSSRKLLVAAINQSVLSWDLVSGELLHTVQGHEPLVNDVCIEPRGGWVASSSQRGIVVSDPRQGVVLRKLRQDGVNAVEFADSDGLLLSGADKETLILWDLRQAAPHEETAHDKAIRFLAIRDKGLFATACEERLVVRADALSSKFELKFADIATLTPRAEDIVIDKSGRLADPYSGSEAGKLHMSFSPTITSVSSDAAGAAALVGSLQGETVLVSLSGEETITLEPLDTPVVACLFAGRSHAVVAGMSGRIVVHPLAGAPANIWRVELGFKLSSVGGSSESPRIIVAGDEGELLVIDVYERRLVMGLKYEIKQYALMGYRGPYQWGRGARSVTLSADGRRGLAMFTLPARVPDDPLQFDGPALLVLEPDAGTGFGIVPDAMLVAGEIGLNGGRALTSDVEGRLRLWDLASGRAAASVWIDGRVTSVTLNDNAFAAGDSRGRVWAGRIDGTASSLVAADPAAIRFGAGQRAKDRVNRWVIKQWSPDLRSVKNGRKRP